MSAYFKRRVSVASIRREPCPYWSDFHTEKISVHLTSGKGLNIFFKDFGFSSVPRPGRLRVGRREIDTYRFLANAKVTGVPQLYGWVWNSARQYYWLFLEDVGHWRLQDGIFLDWQRAVRWLGRFHGRFLNQEGALKRAIRGLPVYHYASYLRVAHAADQALQESARIDDPWSRFRKSDRERLQPVLDLFPKIARRLADQERTLIHGDCYSQNVLLRPRNKARPDVCFVDWETAAVGLGAVDLLALLIWWPPDQSDILIDHYLDALRRKSGCRMDRRLFNHTLECGWIYDTLANVAHMDWRGERYDLCRRYLGLGYRVKRIEQFIRAGSF